MKNMSFVNEASILVCLLILSLTPSVKAEMVTVDGVTVESIKVGCKTDDEAISRCEKKYGAPQKHPELVGTHEYRTLQNAHTKHPHWGEWKTVTDADAFFCEGGQVKAYFDCGNGTQVRAKSAPAPAPAAVSNQSGGYGDVAVQAFNTTLATGASLFQGWVQSRQAVAPATGGDVVIIRETEKRQDRGNWDRPQPTPAPTSTPAPAVIAVFKPTINIDNKNLIADSANNNNGVSVGVNTTTQQQQNNPTIPVRPTPPPQPSPTPVADCTPNPTKPVIPIGRPDAGTYDANGNLIPNATPVYANKKKPGSTTTAAVAGGATPSPVPASPTSSSVERRPAVVKTQPVAGSTPSVPPGQPAVFKKPVPPSIPAPGVASEKPALAAAQVSESRAGRLAPVTNGNPATSAPRGAESGRGHARLAPVVVSGNSATPLVPRGGGFGGNGAPASAGGGRSHLQPVRVNAPVPSVPSGPTFAGGSSAPAAPAARSYTRPAAPTAAPGGMPGGRQPGPQGHARGGGPKGR